METLPGRCEHGGYVYIIDFSTGVVKVGHTRDPHKRVTTHRASAENHGGKVLSVWVSPHSGTPALFEARVLSAVADTQPEFRGREWFGRLSFSRAVEIGRLVCGGEGITVADLGCGVSADNPEEKIVDIGDDPDGWMMASGHLHLGDLRGEGSTAAQLIWVVLLGERTPGSSCVEVTNRRLSKLTSLNEDEVHRGLRLLVRTGAISRVVEGNRRTMNVRTNRGLVLTPDEADIEVLREFCRVYRTRPLAIVTMVVGAYAMVTSSQGEHVDEWHRIPGSQADWRRFIAMRDNASWSARVRTLERAGLIQRRGSKYWLRPRGLWNLHARVNGAQTEDLERLSA